MTCNVEGNSICNNRFLLESEPFDYCHQIDEPSRKGVFGGADFESGFKMFFVNVKTGKKVEKEIPFKDNEKPIFGLRFCISGNKKIKTNSFKNELFINANECSIFNFSDDKKIHEFRPDINLQLLFIIMKPGFLNSSFCKELKKTVHGIDMPSTHGDGEPFNLSNSMSPVMRVCINQICNCPYSGGARSFYFESKIMELIAHNLNIFQTGFQVQNNKLKSSDIDKMHYASELLVKDFKNPPKISDVLKIIGTSRTKFFNDFRQVHGVSPVAYMRSVRMETAKVLLDDQNMNIAEISDFLGFSYPAHFSRAFKAYYGFYPSIYNKKY